MSMLIRNLLKCNLAHGNHVAGVPKCSNREKEEDAAEVQGHGVVDEAAAAPAQAPAASAAL